MYNLCVENRRAYTSGLSSIAATAALSVAALLLVLAWQTNATLDRKESALHAISDYSPEISGNTSPDSPRIALGGSAGATADPNDLSRLGADAFGELIGAYIGLKQSGAYTQETGERIANNVASSVDAKISYTLFQASDIKTDADVSYKRMLAYRSDMRTALLPLLQNTEAEFGIFARYVETGDKSNLEKLSAIAERYEKAAVNAEDVVVPEDAVRYHADVVNSLLQFSATLKQMVKYADDPIASLALLRAYNDAELYVFTSFNSLASYQKNKTT